MKNQISIRIQIVLIVLAIAVAALPTTSYAGSPHVREGWQFGVSYGYSAGRVTLANESEGTG
ncbi:MAG: hypothetical protein ACI9UQ_001266, partial [Candidatus Krumholzibacteriia bacterium]